MLCPRNLTRLNKHLRDGLRNTPDTLVVPQSHIAAPSLFAAFEALHHLSRLKLSRSPPPLCPQRQLSSEGRRNSLEMPNGFSKTTLKAQDIPVFNSGLVITQLCGTHEWQLCLLDLPAHHVGHS
nr:hypothetical protein [Deinococcus terrestris]